MITSIRPVCLVPGLPHAWYRGNTRGLAYALAFTWSASILLLATFVWPEWIGTNFTRFLWFVLGMWWCWQTLANHWNLSKLFQEGKTPANDQRFQHAQDEYLRGNWFEAEAILLAVLADYPRDAEAQLLLVSVLRHTRRWNPALRRLQQLELLDTANPWRFEILEERKRIEKLRAEQLDVVPPEAPLNQESNELEATAVPEKSNFHTSSGGDFE